MLRLPTDLLHAGMILAKPIIDERGSILLRQGVPLSYEYITNLKRRGFASVYISDGDTDDIVIDDIISNEVRRNAQATLARVFDFVRQIAGNLDCASGEAVVASMRDPGIMNALRGHDGFKQLKSSVTSILDELIETDVLTGINEIRSLDDTTFSHSIDVTVVAVMIGRRLHLNRNDLKRLGAGCMLHDIGKIFTRVASTRTPNGHRYPPHEGQYLREHTRLGYELLRSHNPDAVMTNHVALEHHERQDGRGYPRGLHGTNSVERPRSDRQNILLIAEIAAVADVYDILSTSKPGHQALTPKQIANTMRRLAGTFLNKEIAQLFLAMLPTLPTGIDVVVRTGRYADYRGIVVQANLAQPDHPVVRLLYDPHGDRIVPIDLDLAQQQTIFVEAILR